MRPSGAGRVAEIIQEWRSQGRERPWSYEKGMFVSSVGFPAPTVLDFRATEMTMTEEGVRRRRTDSGGAKIFVRMHFVVACRSESCILRMRARFTVATRARIV